jgi:hypothetical protein
MFSANRKRRIVMITLDTVPAKDWLGFAIGISGALLGYAQSKDRLPKWARNWFSRIGQQEIEKAI